MVAVVACLEPAAATESSVPLLVRKSLLMEALEEATQVSFDVTDALIDTTSSTIMVDNNHKVNAAASEEDENCIDASNQRKKQEADGFSTTTAGVGHLCLKEKKDSSSCVQNSRNDSTAANSDCDDACSTQQSHQIRRRVKFSDRPHEVVTYNNYETATSAEEVDEIRSSIWYTVRFVFCVQSEFKLLCVRVLLQLF